MHGRAQTRGFSGWLLELLPRCRGICRWEGDSESPARAQLQEDTGCFPALILVVRGVPVTAAHRVQQGQLLAGHGDKELPPDPAGRAQAGTWLGHCGTSDSLNNLPLVLLRCFACDTEGLFSLCVLLPFPLGTSA